MKYTLPFLIFLILSSCNNHSRESDEIMRRFDSVNQSLERTTNKLSKPTSDLYEALEKKFGDTGKSVQIKRMRYSVQDFYGFISDFKKRFIIACGDSSGTAIPLQNEGDLTITNSFLFLNENNANYLFPRLKSIQFRLRDNVSDSSLRDEINTWNTFKFTEEPGRSEGKEFMKKYFYNAPPVAVITILNKFENDIKTFENQVLSNYLKQ